MQKKHLNDQLLQHGLWVPREGTILRLGLTSFCDWSRFHWTVGEELLKANDLVQFSHWAIHHKHAPKFPSSFPSPQFHKLTLENRKEKNIIVSFVMISIMGVSGYLESGLQIIVIIIQ